MNSNYNIGKVKSLREVRILKRNLKQQLRFHDERIKQETSEVVFDFKRWLTNTLIEKSVTALLTMAFSKMKKKNVAAEE
ncbi:hypothetical protein [Roseimarinus sediminis]|uniref:hypothetical protein n=1 Tax=Roseimarinus sediminis TaxID=1610899 RepID=UPI003D192CB2